ncbi:transcription elongation factor TFIIS [Singapore grouper iridovirus]|uniref:Transcription elongation factor TFIIS n=1 Tax=Singapore grouper iridovirus TaxID=262968 RepID=Q5YFI0_9VIRU|nr:transcription elongation factor TFIIS [Singapore grouper iridovirus]AAS18100.1 transcription elongation factor TFIIS [Singapore grouper iridovirus]WAU86794.1 transcription elongation factor TFIIS [Singapore grouper iridovirus]
MTDCDYYELWSAALEATKGPSDKKGFSHPFFDDMRWREKLSYKPMAPVEEGTLQCPKCGCKKVHVVQRQTRSADEPMTVFAVCSNCGKRWTQ